MGTMREVWIWWGICPRILARRLRTIVAESIELISGISLVIDESVNAVMTLAMNTNDLADGGQQNDFGKAQKGADRLAAL